VVVAHFLALDTVAAVVFWSLLAGKLSGTPAAPLPLFLTACGVWLVYTADRWLDSFPGSREPNPGPRHAFAGRHRRAILVGWSVVFLISLTVGVSILPSDELFVGAAVTALATGYLFAAQQGSMWQTKARSGISKAAAVALLVALAACLFPCLRSAEPPLHRLLVVLGIALLFLPQTLATRFWENGRRLPLLLPASLIAFGAILGGAGSEGSLTLAATVTGIGLFALDRLPVPDKVSLADWTLALGGLVGWARMSLV